jgi:NADH-quinone oxidoreductase subunit G
VAAPSEWLSALSGIIAAVAQTKNIALPAGFDAIEPSVEAKQIAASLMSGEPRAILLGNAAAQHPRAAQLHAAAQWLARNTDAKFGYLTDAANSVGGYIANAVPGKGANALQAFAQPRKAYILLHAEPELDTFDPRTARAALDKAEMVVVVSPYKHGMDYADVLLPVAPFSETSGTFISGEGRAQSFNASVRTLGETRPAWKVLRVLGNLLDISGFDYETSEAIRNEVIGSNLDDGTRVLKRLNNLADLPLEPLPSPSTQGEPSGLERIADVPVYFSDAIVRRAPALQETVDAQAPKAWISTGLAKELAINAGDSVKVVQGQGTAILTVGVDAALPAKVVRIAAAHASTAKLGPMFGAVSVEKA